jgi:hypothetical protein
MQKRRMGAIVDARVCGWAMWEWVAAQPGVSVPLGANHRRQAHKFPGTARSSMYEFAAGLRGSGWLHSRECLCHRVRQDRRCASLLLGYVGVGGCTAKSVCATKSRRRAAGPGPVLGMSGQPCLDRIVLDVGADGVELFGRADPMVEGFVLPEMCLLRGED